MAKIKGKFATLNNTNYVKITIYNKAVTGLSDINIDISNDVRFAEDPIHITQMNDDTFDTIIKTQCEINLVTKRWLGDYLYSPNLTDIVVNVWYGDDCVFAGYVLPMTFKQNYSHVWENVTIKCQDILSTLKDRRLTDKTDYAELVAQSTVRPFSWFINQMGIDDASVVIPNLPDVNTEYMEMAWIETGWMRVINDDNTIDYYGIESECIILDETTALATGNERQGEQKQVTWVGSTDTTIINGVSYYIEYAHIIVGGTDVNTGDWRVSANQDEMPEVIGTVSQLDGWTRGALPIPFQYYEHFTTSYVYSNGMQVEINDYLGDQIPETPLETSYGSYYEFRQGSVTDTDIDEETTYEYYKNYSWCCVNNICENTGDWVRGDRTPYVTYTDARAIGWQYGTPQTPFEYFETVSYYDIYSDGQEIMTGTGIGEQIPLTPQTTYNDSYYELRNGDYTDYTTYEGQKYYKQYSWVCVNSYCEKTNDWVRGELIPNVIVNTTSYITGWTRTSAFEYYEQISNYDIYLTGDVVFNSYSTGDAIPLSPQYTTYGTTYEMRRGSVSDYTQYQGDKYYKLYAWVIFEGNETKTQDWIRGTQIQDYTISGRAYNTISDSSDLLRLLVFYPNNVSEYITPEITWDPDQNDYEYVYDGIHSDAWMIGWEAYSSGDSRLVSYKTIDYTNLDTTWLNGLPGMWDMTQLENIYGLDNCVTTNWGNAALDMMFRNCSSLTTIDLSSFNSSQFITLKDTFYNCSSISYLDLSVLAPNLENVTSFKQTFQNCTSLQNININGIDTSSATTMEYMFYDCNALSSIDVSDFDTSNVTNMCGMFAWCSSLTALDLSNFDTSKVTNMQRMICGCTSLTTLNLSNFDTSITSDMDSMFSQCTSLQTLTMNNVSDSTFNKITNRSATYLPTTVTIYRDGDTYTYKSNQNKWTKD